MTTRKYSSRSQQTTLTAGINSTATSATVVSGSALLGGITISAGETFTVVIDPDTALEEIVDVTAVSTNTLTIVRAIDTSPATGQAHSAGAVVRHMAIGRDYREANNHIENTTTAHGITLANIVKTTDTGTVTSTMITDGTIVNADINASAAIADSKLATISTAGKVANSATTATSANTASAIVARDASGNFTAGTITANVTGNVSGTSGSTTGNAATATALATGRTFQLTGDVEASGVTFDGTGNVSLTTVIGTGAIVNADVNSSAQIAYSKLNLTNSVVNADINASAAIDKTKISGTAVTVADTGTVTSTMIADGTILNADINASAAIDWTKIAPSSTVSATELGYLDGVTSAIQTQIDSKLATATASSTYAPLASPALTGVPTAPTAAANTNTTQVATTAYVQTEITDLIAAAPGALDTLNELATALGNDAAFSTTVTNSLATKLPLAGGTMSGAIAMGTNKITGLGTPTTTGDAATKDYADTKLPLAGGTMSGAIAMGTNKITGAGDPTSAQDVATKNYVDTASIAPSNLTGPITSVGPATSVAAQTGTGSTFVMNTSPTLVTPVLGVATATSINGTTIPASKTLVATDSTQYVVPSQTSNSGKYLTTDGTTSSWGTVDALPSQTSNSGKFLTTNGSAASWAVVAGSLAQPTEPSSPSDGQIWVDTDGTALINQLLRWSKAPANGTTTLSGNDDNSVPLTYSVGYEQVFQNGALLARGSDYTATNGTSISLTNASVTGDIFEVFAAQPVAISDVYTQTQANAAFINDSLLTTTGDTIYASGANTPARLGIGSTGQVLTVASGVPSWATPAGSALVLVKARTNFNNVANTGTTFDNVFTSTYANYVIVLDYISAVNANDTLKFQWRSGGSTYSGGNYYSGYSNVTWNGTSAPVGNSGGTYVSVGTLAAGGNSANYTMNYYSPQDTSANHKVAYNGYSPQLQGYVYGHGFVNTTNANYDGFIISCSTGNIYTGYVTVYGLVKA